MTVTVGVFSTAPAPVEDAVPELIVAPTDAARSIDTGRVIVVVWKKVSVIKH